MSHLPKRKFWMVYGIDTGAPTVMHETIYAAQQEAKRLARKADGTVFVVLEAVGAVVKDDLKTVIFNERHSAVVGDIDDDIPF